MTVEEFVKSVEVHNGKTDHGLSHLNAHFRAGEFTPEDVLNFYARRDTPKYLALVQDFARGKLFIAQQQSFESWAAHDYAKEDKAKAEEYLGLEDSAMQKNLPIRNFIFMRVYGQRPRSNEDAKQVDHIQKKWIRENADHAWRWNS